ncbi:MAG: hypothetical protein KBF26_00590 [Opitutaceae bacterium]|nr:hypothetical protein [Opitutaceae bacterium]
MGVRETKLHAKGRAMRLISFAMQETQSDEFAHVGRRLLGTRRASEIVSSGAGETGRKKPSSHSIRWTSEADAIGAD